MLPPKKPHRKTRAKTRPNPYKTALCALTAITLAATTLTLTTLQTPTPTQAQPQATGSYSEEGNEEVASDPTKWDTDNLDFKETGTGSEKKAGSFGIPLSGIPNEGTACGTADGFAQNKDFDFPAPNPSYSALGKAEGGTVQDTCVEFVKQQREAAAEIASSGWYLRHTGSGFEVTRWSEDSKRFDESFRESKVGETSVWIGKGVGGASDGSASNDSYTKRTDCLTSTTAVLAIASGATAPRWPFSIKLPVCDNPRIAVNPDAIGLDGHITYAAEKALCPTSLGQTSIGLHPRGQDSKHILGSGTGRSLNLPNNTQINQTASVYWCRTDVRYAREFKPTKRINFTIVDSLTGGDVNVVQLNTDAIFPWGRLNCFFTVIDVTHTVGSNPRCVYPYPLPCSDAEVPGEGGWSQHEGSTAAELKFGAADFSCETLTPKAGCPPDAVCCPGEGDTPIDSDTQKCCPGEVGGPVDKDAQCECPPGSGKPLEDGNKCCPEGRQVPVADNCDPDIPDIPPCHQTKTCDPCVTIDIHIAENLTVNNLLTPGILPAHQTNNGGRANLSSTEPHPNTASPPAESGRPTGCAQGSETRSLHGGTGKPNPATTERKNQQTAAPPTNSAANDTAPPPSHNINYTPVYQNLAHQHADKIAQGNCSVKQLEARAVQQTVLAELEEYEDKIDQLLAWARTERTNLNRHKSNYPNGWSGTAPNSSVNGRAHQITALNYARYVDAGLTALGNGTTTGTIKTIADARSVFINTNKAAVEADLSIYTGSGCVENYNDEISRLKTRATTAQTTFSSAVSSSIKTYTDTRDSSPLTTTAGFGSWTGTYHSSSGATLPSGSTTWSNVPNAYSKTDIYECPSGSVASGNDCVQNATACGFVGGTLTGGGDCRTSKPEAGCNDNVISETETTCTYRYTYAKVKSSDCYFSNQQTATVRPSRTYSFTPRYNSYVPAAQRTIATNPATNYGTQTPSRSYSTRASCSGSFTPPWNYTDNRNSIIAGADTNGAMGNASSWNIPTPTSQATVTGYSIYDLTRHLAGPYDTNYLGDYHTSHGNRTSLTTGNHEIRRDAPATMTSASGSLVGMPAPATQTALATNATTFLYNTIGLNSHTTTAQAAVATYLQNYASTYDTAYATATRNMPASGLEWKYKTGTLDWTDYEEDEADQGCDLIDVVETTSGRVALRAERLDFETNSFGVGNTFEQRSAASDHACEITRERSPALNLKYIPQTLTGVDPDREYEGTYADFPLASEKEMFEAKIVLIDSPPVLCFVRYESGLAKREISNKAGQGVNVLAIHHVDNWRRHDSAQHCFARPESSVNGRLVFFDDTAHSNMAWVTFHAEDSYPVHDQDFYRLTPTAGLAASFVSGRQQQAFYGQTWDDRTSEWEQTDPKANVIGGSDTGWNCGDKIGGDNCERWKIGDEMAYVFTVGDKPANVSLNTGSTPYSLTITPEYDFIRSYRWANEVIDCRATSANSMGYINNIISVRPDNNQYEGFLWDEDRFNSWNASYDRDDEAHNRQGWYFTPYSKIEGNLNRYGASLPPNQQNDPDGRIPQHGVGDGFLHRPETVILNDGDNTEIKAERHHPFGHIKNSPNELQFVWHQVVEAHYGSNPEVNAVRVVPVENDTCGLGVPLPLEEQYRSLGHKNDFVDGKDTGHSVLFWTENFYSDVECEVRSDRCWKDRWYDASKQHDQKFQTAVPFKTDCSGLELCFQVPVTDPNNDRRKEICGKTKANGELGYYDSNTDRTVPDYCLVASFASCASGKNVQFNLETEGDSSSRPAQQTYATDGTVTDGSCASLPSRFKLDDQEMVLANLYGYDSSDNSGRNPLPARLAEELAKTGSGERFGWVSDRNLKDKDGNPARYLFDCHLPDVPYDSNWSEDEKWDAWQNWADEQKELAKREGNNAKRENYSDGWWFCFSPVSTGYGIDTVEWFRQRELRVAVRYNLPRWRTTMSTLEAEHDYQQFAIIDVVFPQSVLRGATAEVLR